MRAELLRPFGLVAAGAVIALGGTAAYKSLSSSEAADPLVTAREQAVAQVQQGNAAKKDEAIKEANYLKEVVIDQAYIKAELTRLKQQEPKFTFDVIGDADMPTIRTNIPTSTDSFLDGKYKVSYMKRCANITFQPAEKDGNGNKPKELVDVVAAGPGGEFGDDVKVYGAKPSAIFIMEGAILRGSLAPFKPSRHQVASKPDPRTCAG